MPAPCSATDLATADERLQQLNAELAPSPADRVSPQTILMLARLLAPGVRGSVQIPVGAADAQWRSLLWYAGEEMLTPALFVALRERPDWYLVPALVREYLELIHAMNRARNERLRLLAADVCSILGELDLCPVLLKGGATLFELPDAEFGTRVMIDLDVLIPAARLPECRELLGRNDFIIHPHKRAGQHETVTHRPGDIAYTEVHAGVLGKRANFALPAEDALNRAVPLPGTPVPMRRLCATDRILHNALHSQLQNRRHERGTIDLRSLHEFVEFHWRYGDAVDWRRIHQTFVEHGIGYIFRHYAYLAHVLMHTPMPPGVAPGLTSRLHHRRCMTQVRLPWTGSVFSFGYANLLEWSVAGIRRRYGHGVPLWAGRARHLRYLLKRLFEVAVGKRPTGHSK